MGSLLLKIIIEQLNQYILSVEENGVGEATNKPVILDNIGTARVAGGDNKDLENKVVVSLVNISEEGSLKNNTPYSSKNHQHFKIYPTVHVNLYLLFAANFALYDIAVDHLFRVLEFFQGRKIFKFKNAPLAGADPDLLNQMGELEITVDLHTLSFEQLNDLWGSLGGKQMPFILYRARLVPIQMERPLSREGIITEIDLAIN